MFQTYIAIGLGEKEDSLSNMDIVACYREGYTEELHISYIYKYSNGIYGSTGWNSVVKTG
jgi:hypothetical protein